jgi:hypothetical protein
VPYTCDKTISVSPATDPATGQKSLSADPTVRTEHKSCVGKAGHNLSNSYVYDMVLSEHGAIYVVIARGLRLISLKFLVMQQVNVTAYRISLFKHILHACGDDSCML